RIFNVSPESPRMPHAPGNIMDVRTGATSFRDFSLVNFDSYALGEPGQPAELVRILEVTADFFETIRLQPFLGRGFSAGDDQVEQPRTVLLTHRSWERYFAGDPHVIGRDVRLNTEPYTIIGVLPASFDAPLLWGPTDFVL